MLDYAQLDALVAVVREGSFERAAARLHVTPSAVSQRIKALEERVGAVLVTRGQPCSATAVGAPLTRHAEQVALLEHELRAALPRRAAAGALGSDTEAPTLRVAVNADSLATWFVAAAAAFARDDGALLEIVVDDQEHTAAALRCGDVVAAVSAEAAAVTGARSLPLGKLRYRATASPGFLARHFAAGVNAATLARAPQLLFNRKDTLQARWVRRVCRRDVGAPAHVLPSTQGFVDAAIAGLGWGMNPESLVEEALADGRLVELLPGRALDVPLWWQTSRLALPLLQRLTGHVVAAAAAVLRR